MRKAAMVGAALWCAAQAVAADLVVLVDTSTELPWAHVEGEQIRSGITRDLGEAMARQLDRSARFLVLPRRRAAAALTAGQADIYCALLPEWLPGPHDWSRPFLPVSEAVVSLASAPRPAAMAALAGVPLGTVSGFVYPELEQQLGERFLRDDAPNALANLRKLALGRVQHITTDPLFIDYQRRQGQLNVPLHPYLVYSVHQTRCAVSRRGQVELRQLDEAIAALLGDGSLQRLLARYR